MPKKMPIEEITNDLINYKNKDKTNWLETFEMMAKKYGKYNQRQLDKILIRVIHELSVKGYLIKDYPFKLKKD